MQSSESPWATDLTSPRPVRRARSPTESPAWKRQRALGPGPTGQEPGRPEAAPGPLGAGERPLPELTQAGAERTSVLGEPRQLLLLHGHGGDSPIPGTRRRSAATCRHCARRWLEPTQRPRDHPQACTPGGGIAGHRKVCPPQNG